MALGLFVLLTHFRERNSLQRLVGSLCDGVDKRPTLQWLRKILAVRFAKLLGVNTKVTAVNRLRTERGLSRRAFARAIGVSVETPRAWEAGKCKPHPRHVEKLIAFFERPLAEILAPEKPNAHP